MVNGKPLDEKKLYTLATTTFIAKDGGDDYKMFGDARYLIKPEDGQFDSDILRTAIASVNTIAPRTDGRIERRDQLSGSQPK
jgi:2',3'-cyclic-nucleotide 2'-phosphodiesterase (5'-nucleotidase family)